MLPGEFDALFGQRLRPEQKVLLAALRKLEDKAQSAINDLADSFSFARFETLFLTNQEAPDSLAGAFGDYIKELSSDRVSTISSYQTALKSFLQFQPGIKIGDITVRFLQEYERWMLGNGRSITTVGIYCRSLRSVVNFLIADGRFRSELYPFGSSKKRRYEIPSSRNIKKALTLSEIEKIFRHKCKPGSTAERCKDYWVFLYLANGINVKDFCLLKWDDLDNDRLYFVREKTVRTKKVVEPIEVVIQPEMQRIITKWGARSFNRDTYIFPHLAAGMDSVEVRNKVQLLTRLINDYMKEIVYEIGIKKKVTTYAARHSFATIMKNSGAPIAMISQALGHSSLNTTQEYLASFEKHQLKAATAALTAF
jgi:integrase/recombinase XerD